MKIKVEKLTEEQLRDLDVFSWPIWTKDVSTFDWQYDQQEQCYFLEGDVTCELEGSAIHFGKGDFVTFPKGLECTWDVKEAVRKHYKFG